MTTRGTVCPVQQPQGLGTWHLAEGLTCGDSSVISVYEVANELIFEVYCKDSNSDTILFPLGRKKMAVIIDEVNNGF